MENYRVLEVVGSGSFGTVHKGEKIETKEVVALKFIKKRKKLSKEFQNVYYEFEIQRKLIHKNIIRLVDSFETEDQIVVVTEFIPRDLFKIIADRGQLSEDEVRKIMCDLVSALHYLHSSRILHRDLKPQNVLVEFNGTAKLCDFGFARFMNIDTFVVSSIKGTPMYMAPELIRNQPYDHTADLWSLGCIVYECLMGSPPFYIYQILGLLRSEENIKYPDSLSPDCLSFLSGLLQVDPKKRLSWPNLLDHPFLGGAVEVNYSIDNSVAIPLTHPLTASQNLAREKQREDIMHCANGISRMQVEPVKYLEQRLKALKELQLQQNIPPVKNSPELPRRHSDNCVLQSSSSPATDIDCITSVASAHSCQKSHTYPGRGSSHNSQKHVTDTAAPHNNLDLKRKNKEKLQIQDTSQMGAVENICDKMGSCTSAEKVQSRKVKVNSDLCNKTEKTLGARGDDGSKNIISRFPYKQSENSKTSSSGKWMLEDDPQTIECDEWLSFLQKTMEEVMAGEVESMKQENFVTMLTAPLRNPHASSKVIEYVACLLSLPFIVPCISDSELVTVKQVYLKVKVVPNLIYASKILSRQKNADSDDRGTFSLQSDLGADKLHALECIYLLLCHLVHADKEFLVPFCDTITMLNGIPLLQQLLLLGRRKARVVADLLAILAHILCVLPENACFVEHVVLGTIQGDSGVDLGQLLALKCSLVRARFCLLIRLLGLHSHSSLRKVWTTPIQCQLENLLQDSNDAVRSAAKEAVNELKHVLS